MKKITLIFWAIILIFASCKTEKNNTEMKFQYPETKKVDTVDNYFGVEVADPYRWLEDDNSDETKVWVVEQNKLTFSYLDSIPFRQKIKDRLTEIYNYERYSTPFKKGGKYFYFKNDGLQNQSVMYMQTELEGEATELLDPNTLSEDGTVALSNIAISKDGKFLAYSIARSGSDWNEIFVKNIETGETLSDHVMWVKFSGIAWYKDGFFYSRYDEPKEGEELTTKNENQKVFYHKIGTQQVADELIFQNPANPKRGYSASVSDDEKLLILSEWESTSGNGLYYKKLDEPNSEVKNLFQGFDHDYSFVDYVDGKMLVLTNENAPKYKLVCVDISTEEAQVTDLIPEKENVLSNCGIGNNMLVANYMQDAHTKAEVYDLQGNFVHEIELPGLGTVGGLSMEKDETTAFYKFTSFTIPGITYKYDFETNTSEIFRKPEIGLDLDQYETKQVFYTSKDGTKIPMFIVHKKGIELNGDNPTLLYGYGGFNISLTPSFSITRMVWLENGGVLAVANLRGGGEYGEKWHKAGTLLQKQNVFDDFISAAEYLIAEKYTSSQKLAIQGGSNGGLLVGAVTNQRPELFQVALPAVGVLDMLRYHLFTIGAAWATDYGLSSEEEHFKNLYKYSPLHTIKSGVEYPAVLVTTGDHDDRVVPAHSFKYIATLQEKHTGSNPVMIRIETNAGHGAGKPTEKIIQEAADIYAFTFFNMRINL